MQITLIDAQRDGGSACPHIVRIWKGSNLVYEYVAKPNDVGVVASHPMTLPNDVYDFEVVNPNLWESSVKQSMFWYNPNDGGSTSPVGNAVSVPACSSNKVTVDGNSITNLTVETLNYGTNPANVLYQIVGQDAITTGTDKDGNTLSTGDSYFQNIGFKKIADNTMSALVIDNKKNWSTSDGASVDVSSYIPYITKTVGSGTGGGTVVNDVPKPILSANTIVVNSTVTITNQATVGYTSMLIYKTVAGGLTQVFPNDGDFTLANGIYTFLQAGAFSFVGKIGDYRDSPIGGLIVTSVLPKPTIDTLVRFVNETSTITNGGSYTGIIAKKDGNLATATDIDVSFAVSFGVNIAYCTFKTAGSFTFIGTKAGIANSPESDAVVVSHNVLLPKPIPSAFAKFIGESVTITNTASYTTINCYYNDVLATSAEISVTGGAYTLLKAGNYTFFGYKPNFELSVASDIVVVSVPVVVPPIVREKYTLTMKNLCTVDITNIQVGTGATAAVVNNWVDGLVITIDVTDNIRPNFFVRDKTNVTNISKAKAYVVP